MQKMKLLDKIIRSWRVRVALKNTPKAMSNVFDIGCDDGYLLRKLASYTERRDGLDPCLRSDVITKDSEIRKGFFPSAIKDYQLSGKYDVIFALAVFEHFSELDIKQSVNVIPKMLSPRGRLIITVPHPFVDLILDVLKFLHLIDGQALEEHHGFEPEDLIKYFSVSLKLIKREKFQFGLNNIFVFERL
jgi:2-polyprenyl-3-methyl-5-hydroxy-6-metoxy-1,4-benzoquinol methylase